MSQDDEHPVYALILFLVVFSVAILFVVVAASAHDHDQSHDAWYKSLKQPDSPLSCCGKADAYWCDDYYARDGRAYCKITDDQDDAPLMRPHVPIGTEIEIPQHKLKWEQGGEPIGNPTGHAIVFLSMHRDVYCYVQATGI